MNYIYLANARAGLEVLRWLVEQKQPPIGLVVHPGERSQHRDDIIGVSGLSEEYVIDAPQLRKPDGQEWLRAFRPDWLISVSFGYLLRPEVLSIPLCGAVNLHPALLPYNRGAYPNVWSIVEHTPAGVTLHLIDPGVDTGDIIAQRPVAVETTDTGASLYERLEKASLALFQDTWPLLCTNSFHLRPQDGNGTFHRVADVEKLDRIDPDQQVRAGDLIDLIRARTFPPYKGAYLDLQDRRVYLRLELTEEMK